MNVTVDQLQPGVFGVSHGGGMAGQIIRDATGSKAGHAFLYLGGGQIGQLVQGQPPVAGVVPGDSHADANWAWQMWDKLKADDGWTDAQVTAAQQLVVTRGRALIGTPYDWPAYLAFAAEVLHLRTSGELAPWFSGDRARVCSALVDDALRFGGVPLDFTPEDGPDLVANPGSKAPMPPNLVAPGMLYGLGLRKGWGMTPPGDWA